MQRDDVIQLISTENRLFIEQSTALVFFDYLMKLPEEGRLVEIGTGAGDSTGFFASIKPKWTIYTIDGYGLFGTGNIYPYGDEDKERTFSTIDLEKNLHRFMRMGNIIQIIQDSSRVPWELPVDVIFIDGDHTYEGCMADFMRYSPFLKKDGYIFIHDYYRTDLGVKKCVDEVCQKGWKLLYAEKAAILERNI